MLHMPCPMLLGGEQLTPYQRFQAHIAELASGRALAFSDTLLVALQSYVVTADLSSALGGMVGSSWLQAFRGDSTSVARAIQHGLASETVFTAQRTNGWQMLLTIGSGDASSGYAARTRNGFASSSSSSSFGARTISQILLWDGAQSLRMTPDVGSGPTTYNF